ncbi:hypothetical protein K4F52_009758 [Lecanicillium sp. MT-2017a]|nr:hypothetical protein K4F52_009758 [Lecanicillium sp. MT-2017a]
MATCSTPAEAPWHAAYPSPRSTKAAGITRQELLKKMEDSGNDGTKPKNFLLVDLRRTDYEVRACLSFGHATLLPSRPSGLFANITTVYRMQGGTIRGSINLPAQSLYPSIPTLHILFKAAGLRSIIWYCGSSRGRGTRAARWFQDYLDDCGDTGMESLVLLDGVAGWATGGAEYVGQMSDYAAKHWQKK